MRKIYAAVLVVLALVVLSLTLLNRGADNSTQDSEKLAVTASFYPMAEFSRQVGGDNVTVSILVGPGVEPHDYDPSPRDIAELKDSAVFVYNGGGIEPWAEKIVSDLGNGGVSSLNASRDLPEANTDPHVWLDPVRAQKQVASIRDAFIEADPENADKYKTNADKYRAQLAKLDSEFTNGLAQCQRRDVVTSHEAFKYLAERYKLQIIPISGISPDEEPSPQKLAEVAALARQKNVTHVFLETLASSKLSETVAREIGVQTLVLNPLEGLTDTEVAANADYLSVQRDNLKNLRLALGCN